MDAHIEFRDLAIAGLLAAVAAGCSSLPVHEAGVGQSREAQAAGNPRDATTAGVATALQQQGVLTPSEAQMLVPLGAENGWTVMLAPGLPDSAQRLSMVAAGTAGFPTDSPITRWTTDAWSSSTDTAGQLYMAGGAPVLFFPLAGATQLLHGTFIQAALRIGGTWLNHGGADYRFVVASPSALSWIGNLTAGQDGMICTIPGQDLFAGHDTSVTVDTYPMLPSTSATLHYSSDGYVTIHDISMALGGVNVGPYGNDARWVGTVPTGTMGPGLTVALWAEATSSGPGGTLWDSRQGQNYVAAISAPPAVAWADLGTYEYLASPTGWYYGFSDSLADPLSATPGDFQAYAPNPSPAVEVYVPGITDASGGAAPCGGGFVLVQAWSPFFSGTPDGVWAAYTLPFVETSGNNCRFKWVLQYGAYTAPPPGVNYPPGGNYPVDGSYAYKLRISTDGGATWQWLGTGGLPDGGGNRTMNWVAPYHG